MAIGRLETQHNLRVQAINSQGTAPPSSPLLSVKTSEDAPQDPPLNVACVIALYSQSLQMTGSRRAGRRAQRIFLRGYCVFYESASGNDPTATATDDDVWIDG